MREITGVALVKGPAMYKLPIGAKLLHVQEAEGQGPLEAKAWFEADEGAAIEFRYFTIVWDNGRVEDSWVHMTSFPRTDEDGHIKVDHLYELPECPHTRARVSFGSFPADGVNTVVCPDCTAKWLLTPIVGVKA